MPSKKPPKKELPPGAKLLTEKSSTEQFKYVAAVLEQVQDQVKAIAESLDMTRTELKGEIQSVRTELKGDIGLLQMAVSQHSQEIKALQQEVRRVGEKIDSIVEKVEHHDEEIVFLKATIAK